MARAPLAAAGEQTLREKLRRDAHGTEQTFVARQRRAQRMAHLTGTAVERVYRVSPTRNPADYDPEELYLHLRDEHDLRVEACEGASVLSARSDGRSQGAIVEGAPRHGRPRSDGPCARRRCQAAETRGGAGRAASPRGA